MVDDEIKGIAQSVCVLFFRATQAPTKRNQQRLQELFAQTDYIYL